MESAPGTDSSPPPCAGVAAFWPWCRWADADSPSPGSVPDPSCLSSSGEDCPMTCGGVRLARASAKASTRPNIAAAPRTPVSCCGCCCATDKARLQSTSDVGGVAAAGTWDASLLLQAAVVDHHCWMNCSWRPLHEICSGWRVVSGMVRGTSGACCNYDVIWSFQAAVAAVVVVVDGGLAETTRSDKTSWDDDARCNDAIMAQFWQCRRRLANEMKNSFADVAVRSTRLMADPSCRWSLHGESYLTCARPEAADSRCPCCSTDHASFPCCWSSSVTWKFLRLCLAMSDVTTKVARPCWSPAVRRS